MFNKQFVILFIAFVIDEYCTTNRQVSRNHRKYNEAIHKILVK
jgi:hypothetical protein